MLHYRNILPKPSSIALNKACLNLPLPGGLSLEPGSPPALPGIRRADGVRAWRPRGVEAERCRDLIEFYRGIAPDSEGRTLADLWAFSDDEMEEVHDFIQWMFPLREPSRFNPDAPLLTDEDVVGLP